MTEKRFYMNEGEVGILKILDLKEDNISPSWEVPTPPTMILWW